MNVQVVPEEERRLYYQKLGPGFKHYHHYCWALIHMSRATRSSTFRGAHFRSAIGDFDYVLRAADKAFPMLPEVHLRKGLALQLFGDELGAAVEFTNAIKLKSDYTPAYAALIDLYVDLGNTDEAEEVLKSGLSQVPDSKILAGKKADLAAARGSLQR